MCSGWREACSISHSHGAPSGARWIWIVAGVATSHVPAIGAAIALGKPGEPYWQP